MTAIIVSVSRIWKPREFIWINIVGLRYKKKVIVHRFFSGGFPHCVRTAASAVPLLLHSSKPSNSIFPYPPRFVCCRNQPFHRNSITRSFSVCGKICRWPLSFNSTVRQFEKIRCARCITFFAGKKQSFSHAITNVGAK